MKKAENGVGWDAVFWLASSENKDQELREMAKDILDKLCHLEQLRDIRNDKNVKKH